MPADTFTREVEDTTTFPETVIYEVTFAATLSTPGYLAGAPEDCFPSEPGEIEILSVTLDGTPIQDFGLSTEVLDKIELRILEHLESLSESEVFGAGYFEPENCHDC